jgi:hypothetical protein
MENTNLSEMIKDQDPAVFEAANLDLPAEETMPIEESVDAPEPQAEAVPEVESIQTAPLNVWFEENSAAFNNISQVKVAIRGINPNKTLIMAVLDGGPEVDGNPSRDLQVFKNADAQPVLNIPANDMQIYNNGFRLIYQYDDLAIKAYGVRTGLICVFCNIISDNLVPYSVVKVKKKDAFVPVPRCSSEEVTAKLALNADLEAVQLLYKQISKSISELQTNSSVVSWLLTRQSEVTDINHHLQIDNVIIDILS